MSLSPIPSNLLDYICQTEETEAYEWLEAEEEKDPDYKEQLRHFSVWLHPTRDSLITDTACSAQCRRKLANRLHSMPVNIAVIVLATMDAVILIAVMLLEIEALKLEPGQKQTDIQNARFALECVSICILTVFMAEVILKFIAVGPKHFCCHWLEVVDAIVTAISLVVDALVIADHVIHLQHSHSNEHESSNLIGSGLIDSFGSAAGLLIVFRLWRVVRIVTATVLSIHMGMEHKLTELREKRVRLERRVFQLERRLQRLHIPLPKDLSDDEEHHARKNGHHHLKSHSSKILFSEGSEEALPEYSTTELPKTQ